MQSAVRSCGSIGAKGARRAITAASFAALIAIGARAQIGNTMVSELENGLQLDQASTEPSVSADGRYVAFTSDCMNFTGDTNGFSDVYVRDRFAQRLSLISVSTSGTIGNAGSFSPVISGDGRYVAFVSNATNLIASDTNSASDVFLRDRDSDADGVFDEAGFVTTIRASSVQGDFSSVEPAISNDGRYVAFESYATNFESPSPSAAANIYVYDRSAGTTTRANVTTSGAQPDGMAYHPSISGDGRFVTFTSAATNLLSGADTNNTDDIFLRDRQSGTTTRVSVSSAGAQTAGTSSRSAISRNGSFVTWVSTDGGLVTGDTNGFTDIFRRNLGSGTTIRISNGTSGQPNSTSDTPSISSDGSFVAFSSYATNLITGGTSSGIEHVYRYDVPNTTIALESATCGASVVQGSARSFGPSISDSGEEVVYATDATNLDASDMNVASDVFARDHGSAAAYSYCFGDGTSDPCPCGASTLGSGEGCPNSLGYGAILSASGTSALSFDNLVLTGSNMPATTTCLFFQGTIAQDHATGTPFGDGIRCVGGSIIRIGTKICSGGVATYPQGGDTAISGVGLIPSGGCVTRYYQAWYRNSTSYCTAATFNLSSAVMVDWLP